MTVATAGRALEHPFESHRIVPGFTRPVATRIDKGDPCGLEIVDRSSTARGL